MDPRKSFLFQPAPENYVAGLGRGATGFTTRSDLGPARDGPSDEQIKEILAKRAVQLGLAKKKEAEENDEDPNQDPDNEVGLFAGGVYDKDDEEADQIYRDIEDKMDRRRKARREAHEKEEREEYERKNPKIQQQFADLKRALGAVTDDEWAALPEAGDLTGKNKRAREALRQRSYAVPDSVLAAASQVGQLGTTIVDDNDPAAVADGADTSVNPGTVTNFAKISAARNKVLQVKLDRASESAAGTATRIDAGGYLTSLNMQPRGALAGDINRARELMRSVTKTNPNNAPGWITASRVEEVAGKIAMARRIIAEGCKQCPRSEDVWLENIRLNEGHNAKVIAKDAIVQNKNSVRLWVEAMKLETDKKSQVRVVRRALEHIPESEALWKELVNLEDDPQTVRQVLAQATELIPQSVDLWLALARLETAENAQKVLNKARKNIPTSHEVWIAAARLQEQLGTRVNVMERAVRQLAKLSAMPKREEWIAEAEKCEEEDALQTCTSIIYETLGFGLDEDENRKDVFMEDARGCIGRGKYATARAIYGYALRVFPTSRTIWMAAADLERSHGTRDQLWQVLHKAVEACPQSEVLWMMLAKEKWLAGHVDEARVVLAEAFKHNDKSEDIWLAAVKLEAENGHVSQARDLLREARQKAPTDRVWMKSVVLERQLADLPTALDLVTQALVLFPKAPKLWMLKGQVYEDMDKRPQAREAFASGVKACPASVPLWLLYARLEERGGAVVKARSVLERGRLAVAGDARLWVESVRVERRAGNLAQARMLMAKAMQECPHTAAAGIGLLWAEKIWHLEPRTARRTRALEAISEVDNDPVLSVVVARMFWGERKLQKAQNWFEKALVMDSDNGDSWAWYYKFLSQHGLAEKIVEVKSKCIDVAPCHGEVWARVRKDPRNYKMDTLQVLDAVAAELQ